MEGFFYVKSNGDSKKYSRQAWKISAYGSFGWFLVNFCKNGWISGTKSGIHMV